MITRLRLYMAAATALLALATTPIDVSAQAQRSTSRVHALDNTQQTLDKQTSIFIENKGQWDNRAKFLLRSSGLDMWITDHGVVYDLHRTETAAVSHPDMILHLPMEATNMTKPPERVSRSGQVVTISFEGGAFAPAVQGNDRQRSYYNYFIGNDPAKWANNVGLYGGARIYGLYAGIDAVFYLDKGLPRYDLVVAPGADPRQVKMRVGGADAIGLTADGALAITTTMGTIEQRELYAYQVIEGVRRQIECRFAMDGTEHVIFELGSYDRTKPLVVDPLVYSTFIGGSGTEAGSAIAIDSSGNAYLTGYAYASTYPVTEGAYDESFNGGSYDLFVTKLDSSGSNLLYSTFIGGGGSDAGTSIAVDDSGNTYVVGYSESSTALYPTTSGAFDDSINGPNDAVVTKLNSTGRALLYSTFIGGSLREGVSDIAIDSNGNAYLVGVTGGTGAATVPFPTTAGAYDATLDGFGDIFVAKLDSSGSTLLYSTLIGGNNYDNGLSIAADNAGNAYVTGYTNSTNYPTTTEAFDRSHNGDYDLFVTKVNSSGSALLYSTYIGGTGTDQGYAIAIDDTGNAFVAGFSADGTYPTTPGAYDESFNGKYDVVVTKLNSSGSALLYSTFMGGDTIDYGYGIAVDRGGSAYVTGVAFAGNVPYPTTPGAYDENLNGIGDLFITKLNASGNALLYSTFIGGSAGDASYGIAIDGRGNAYVTGYSNAGTPSFPTTAGAFNENFNGGTWDIVVVKLDLTGSSAVPQEPDIFDLQLNAIAPNPTSDRMQVSYTLPESMTVMLEIYRSDGRRVGVLVDGEQREAGSYHQSIAVGELTPGVYTLRMVAGDHSRVQRFVVVR